jgi:hypothetical protein
MAKTKPALTAADLHLCEFEATRQSADYAIKLDVLVARPALSALAGADDDAALVEPHLAAARDRAAAEDPDNGALARLLEARARLEARLTTARADAAAADREAAEACGLDEYLDAGDTAVAVAGKTTAEVAEATRKADHFAKLLGETDQRIATVREDMRRRQVAAMRAELDRLTADAKAEVQEAVLAVLSAHGRRIALAGALVGDRVHASTFNRLTQVP